MHIEGGFRGVGPSSRETSPCLAPNPTKRGYDEHRATKDLASVHGVPGAEGVPFADAQPTESAPEEPHGYGAKKGFLCKHGCAHRVLKSRRGMARHVETKHGQK